jgi:hypothetical protein
VLRKQPSTWVLATLFHKSFDSAMDSDDPARAVPPIRLTVPGASTVELTDVARLVNPQSPKP